MHFNAAEIEERGGCFHSWSSYLCGCRRFCAILSLPSIILTDQCVSVVQTALPPLQKEQRQENRGDRLGITHDDFPLRQRIFVSPLSIRDCVSQLLGTSCALDMLFPVKRRRSLLFHPQADLVTSQQKYKIPAGKLLSAPEPAGQRSSDK